MIKIIIKSITDNLCAMGATPTAETDKNGNTLIGVNAPTVPTPTTPGEGEK